MMIHGHRRQIAFLLLALAIGQAGCGGGAGTTTEAPKVDPDQAREALETALNAWKAGETPGSLAKAESPLQVFDSQWDGGKTLEGFTIVGEDAGGNPSAKVFNVTLKFAGAKAETKARYLVSGSDPIQVYHESDFAKLLNPTNAPPATKKK
ncbi:MAG: hypothetical protein AB7I30_00400 [Isosphaeraceae bacterium]